MREENEIDTVNYTIQKAGKIQFYFLDNSIMLIPRFVLLILIASSASCEEFKVCPVKSICRGKSNTSEIEKWECLGDHLFRGTNTASQQLFVEHDCYGVGWGNSIRGLTNAASVAMVLNRRLIIKFEAFNRLWLPPNGLGSSISPFFLLLTE